MQTIRTSFLLLIAHLCLTACGGRQTIDAIGQIEQYEAAHNAYDVEGTMSLFAQGAEFELVGQGTLPNLEAIRAIHEYDVGIQAQVHFENCVAEDLTVTCQAQEQNDWLAAANLGEIFYPNSVFAFNQAGQIQKISTTISQADGAKIAAVLADFIPWLLQERPDESRQLFTADGVFIYSNANGILVVELLRQWRAGERQ